MVNKKEYTNAEYEKFLTTPYSADFGISEDKIISTFMTSASTAKKVSLWCNSR